MHLVLKLFVTVFLNWLNLFLIATLSLLIGKVINIFATPMENPLFSMLAPIVIRSCPSQICGRHYLCYAQIQILSKMLISGQSPTKISTLTGTPNLLK